RHVDPLRAAERLADVVADDAGHVPRHQQPQRHSTTAFDSMTIAFHLSASFWTNCANCAAEPPTGSAPSRIICASSEGSASLTALLISAIAAAGVPFGAKKPNHEPASN